MTRTPQSLGKRGEEEAIRYLQEIGYSILARNWHCTTGEIDIVAVDKETLIFVEVKTCTGNDTEKALLNLTPSKQNRILSAAYTYLEETSHPDDNWRIDIVAIAVPKYGDLIIEHWENGLDW